MSYKVEGKHLKNSFKRKQLSYVKTTFQRKCERKGDEDEHLVLG